MPKAYTLMTAPAVEPVLLSDVKTFCRVDGTADDSLLTSLIVTARRMCEEFTKRAFITQTWKLTMDGFAWNDDFTPGFSVGPTPEVFPGIATIQLSRQPIQSISSIVTYNLANTSSTVSASVYTLDTAGGRILLNDGQVWPSNLRANAAVEALFVAGYGADGGFVPDPIKQAIMQTVATMYQSRMCSDLPEGVKTLLSPYTLPEAYGLV